MQRILSYDIRCDDILLNKQNMADITGTDNSEIDTMDDATTSDLKIGDVVAIKTLTLFEEREYKIEMLCHNYPGMEG